MPTKRRPFSDPLVLGLGALLLVGGAALAAPSLGGTKRADDPVRTGYALESASAQGSLAGVEKSAIVVPGLVLQDTVADDGGLVFTYVDAAKTVRAIVRLEVATDADGARRFLDHQLHGIARILPALADASLGDLVYGDESGATIVLGTMANVAFDVRLVDAGNAPDATGKTPSAKTIAGIVRAAMRPGVPMLPTPKVSLPAEVSVQTGAEVVLTGLAGQTPALRVDGGYVAHGSKGPILRPFAPGPITVRAIVVDELARVGVGTATTLAK